MKKRESLPNVTLVIVLGMALAVCRIIKTWVPMGVLPELNIPNMVLISLVALLMDHYWSGKQSGGIWMPLLAALTFGLLPFAAGFVQINEALKLAITGGVVFAVTAWIWNNMCQRLTTGLTAKAAPLFNALGLYLAVQCFTGIIL